MCQLICTIASNTTYAVCICHSVSSFFYYLYKQNLAQLLLCWPLPFLFSQIYWTWVVAFCRILFLYNFYMLLLQAGTSYEWPTTRLSVKKNFFLRDPWVMAKDSFTRQATQHDCLPSYADKKENEIFLLYKLIQMGSGAKSFMRKGMSKCANIF